MDTQDTSTPSVPRSRTLENIGIYPDTACTTCPNALWFAQKNQPKTPIPFCKIMHSMIDFHLTECDGNPNLPARLDLPTAPEAEFEELTQEQYIAGMPDSRTPPTID